MSRTVNKIILVGNVGQDPDIQEDAEGMGHAWFSLATHRQDPELGEQEHPRTDWHRVQALGRLAQFAKDYLNKGDRVYIEGRLEYDSYERDGITIPTADIIAREVVLLSPAQKAGQTAKV